MHNFGCSHLKESNASTDLKNYSQLYYNVKSIQEYRNITLFTLLLKYVNGLSWHP